MTKKSSTSKRPGWVEAEEREEPLDKLPERKYAPKPASVIRCIWHTRLVIEASRTVSGRRYVFEPQEVRGDVHPDDVPGLLAMEKEQPPGCCAPGATPTLKYFEEV